MKPSSIAEPTKEELEKQAYFDSFEHNRSPLKILFGIYKGNYKLLLISVFFYLLQILPTVVLPLVTANVINIATQQKPGGLTELTINAVVMLLLIVMNIPTTFLSTKNRSKANRRVEVGLRSSMARKLQQLSMTYYKDMASGRMQSKIMRDVENIEGLSTSLFTSTVNIVFSLTTALVITLTKSLVVFMFFVVTVPVAVLIIHLFSQKLDKRNESYRSTMETANASVNEMVELLPVTKAHALEQTALSRFNRQLYRVADTGYELDCTNAIFGSSTWVIFRSFSLACIIFSGYLAYKGMILVGDITLYSSYFSTVVDAVSGIISLLPIISKGFESVRSIGDIMWAMDVEDEKNKKALSSVRGDFSFRHVDFYYPDVDHPILKDFNLEIKAGETIALVGESGSGKSTLLNMLIGFYRPSGGTILLDGNDINDINLQSYRSHIATVPQTSVLFSASIRENITYGMDNVTEEQLREAIRIANLEEVIRQLPHGLDTNVGEHGDKLSGGQKQRIAIARAVIRNASIIILDEATSALDTLSEKLIQNSIEQLSHDHTIFIVAHRLSTIRNADKIAVVKDGQCAEFGTYQELMDKKGEFYRFQSLQV